jgi:pro-sigmaK processing inhibitor BofA
MIFKICVSFIILITIIYYLKRKRKILSFLIGSITGVSALFLLNKFGEYINYIPPLNFFNIIASGILGIPYVVTLFVINLIS